MPRLFRDHVGLARSALLLTCFATCAAGPNQTVSPTTTLQTLSPLSRGTENQSLNLQIVPAPKTAKELDEEAADRKHKLVFDWWMEVLTAALVVVGCIQGLVFLIQARRLKATIVKMDDVARGQTADMAASIAESARAASAMENVASAMMLNSKTTTEMAGTQREFWLMQMRAYLMVSFGNVIPQDDSTGWRTEVRLNVVNNGLTPAHDVSYLSNADVLPFPLPADFAFPLQTGAESSTGVLGHNQTSIMACSLRHLLSVDEIASYTTGNSRVYMWGVVSYTDISGVDRQTKFCQSIMWLRNGGAMGVNTRRHNEAN